MTSQRQTDAQENRTKALLKELEISRQLLEETEQTGNIGGWEFDVKNLTQRWTQQTFRILEIDTTHGEPQVPQGVEYIDPPYRDMANEAIKRAIEYGKPYDQEWEITTFKGNKRWVHAVGKARKQNGKVVSVYGSFQDITKRKKAEEKLQESQRRFTVALKDSPITLIELDCDLRFLWVYNPLIGRTPEEMIGKKIGETGTTDDITPLRELYLDVLKTGLTRRSEVKLKHGDREAFYDIYVEPSRDKEGNIVGVTSASTDISELKRAEQALERQAKLIDLSPDGIIVRKVDGTITFWSKGAEKLYGWSREEAIGRKVHDLLETQFLEPFEKIMLELKRGKSWTGELVHSTKDGRNKVVESRWLAESEKSGVITDLLESNVDITERKKAEDALKESEELYRTIFENSEDGFQLVKPIFDGKGDPIDYLFLQVNKAYERQVGLKAEQVVGRTVREIVPNIEPEWIETHGQVAKTGKSLHREIYNDFSKRWYDLYYFKYKEGQVGVLFRDITARKNLEKSLQENERLATIGQTAGMVGHDIRNPLQAIVSELYLAKGAISKATDSECKQEVTESISFIQEQVDYINKIVADLQDFARVTKPSITEVNLEDLVENAFSAIPVPENIQAVCDVEPNLIIKSDPAYLRRMITNLCNNAIQAMPEGGKLTLTAQQKGNSIEMTVSDTGEGIPEELKEKMFKPLFTTKAKGQGFGLAVVKKFAEQLGGSITFDSQVGRGTTFRILLPLMQEPNQSPK